MWQIQVGQLQGGLRDARITGGGMPGNSCGTEPASAAMQMECQENTSLVRASTCSPVCGSDCGPGTLVVAPGQELVTLD